MDHLTNSSIDDGHHDFWFAQAHKHQAASRLGCHDPKPSYMYCLDLEILEHINRNPPDTRLNPAAFNRDVRHFSTQELLHVSGHFLGSLPPGCLKEINAPWFTQD